MLSFLLFAFDLVNKIRLFCYDFVSKNRNEKKKPLPKTRELSKNARYFKKSLHLCPRDPFCENKPNLSNQNFDP